MSTPSETPPPVTVETDMVAVEKSLEEKERGVVVTLALSSNTDNPVAVRIVETIPEECPTDDLGFHPDHEPHDWSIEDGHVVCEAIAPLDDGRPIVYGITLGEGAEPDAIQLLGGEPTIDRTRWVDPTALEKADNGHLFPESEFLTNGADSGNVDDPEDHDTGMRSLLSSVKDSVIAEEGDGDGDTEAEAEDRLITADGPGEIEPDPSIDANGSADAPTGDVRADGAVAPDPEGGDADTRDHAPVDEVGGDGGGSGEPQSPDADTVSDPPQVDGEADSAGPGPTGSEPGPEATTGSAAEGEPPRSLDVRLRHLQSRMDDFAAYVDALEGIIDERGTATEIEAEIDDLRDEAAEAETQREELRDRVDELSDTVISVEEEVSTVTTELESLRSEVDEIRGEIEALSAMREGLSQAFEDIEADVEPSGPGG